MKYIVMVNQKHLVTVEAETSGGAEHKILDDVYYGIETCQAFSLNELSTDFFKGCAEKCETISYSELFDKAKRYKDLLDAIEAEEEELSEYRKRVKNLEEQIKLQEMNVDISDENLKQMKHQLSVVF